jgi:hypothetical protein
MTRPRSGTKPVPERGPPNANDTARTLKANFFDTENTEKIIGFLRVLGVSVLKEVHERFCFAAPLQRLDPSVPFDEFQRTT